MMEKIQRINRHFERHGYNGSCNIYEWSENEVLVCISWGDWKKDHRYVEYLMGLMGYEQTDKKVTENDGSDCFSADHLFRERTDYRYVSAGPYEGECKAIAKALRAGDVSVLERTAQLLSPLVRDADVLVPMPSCDGKPNAIHALCETLSKRNGVKHADILRTKSERISMCQAKADQKAGILVRLPYPEELMMYAVSGIPSQCRPVIIDNVIASGTTAVAALNALHNGNAVLVALADDVRCQKIINFNSD